MRGGEGAAIGVGQPSKSCRILVPLTSGTSWPAALLPSEQVPLGIRSLLQLSNERIEKVMEETAQVRIAAAAVHVCVSL